MARKQQSGLILIPITLGLFFAVYMAAEKGWFGFGVFIAYLYIVFQWGKRQALKDRKENMLEQKGHAPHRPGGTG